MKLFLVLEGERKVWIAAVVGQDVYTYVDNTGHFHVNEAIGDDYFGEGALEYRPIGVSEARELIAEHVGHLDEQKRARPLAEWRDDPDPVAPDTILAMASADQH